MTIIQIITLSFMQGFTELLPISSSGYMVIASWVLGWDSPPAAFDATVHLGSLAALALFFRRDWMLILQMVWRDRDIPLGGDDDLMSSEILERYRKIGDMRRRLSLQMSMPSRNLLEGGGSGIVACDSDRRGVVSGTNFGFGARSAGGGWVCSL